MKEFKGNDSKSIFLNQENIYVNYSKRQKKEDFVKMEAGEEITGYTDIKIKEIKEVWSKKSSKDVNIILKTGDKKWFEAGSKKIRDEIIEELNKLSENKFKKTEKLYTMKERVKTPIIYTVLAVLAGIGMVWLAKAQPVIVERKGFVKSSEAGLKAILKFIEGMGVENAILAGVALVILSLLYMALRVVKPPVKMVLEIDG